MWLIILGGDVSFLMIRNANQTRTRSQLISTPLTQETLTRSAERDKLGNHLCMASVEQELLVMWSLGLACKDKEPPVVWDLVRQNSFATPRRVGNAIPLPFNLLCSSDHLYPQNVMGVDSYLSSETLGFTIEASSFNPATRKTHLGSSVAMLWGRGEKTSWRSLGSTERKVPGQAQCYCPNHSSHPCGPPWMAFMMGSMCHSSR